MIRITVIVFLALVMSACDVLFMDLTDNQRAVCTLTPPDMLGPYYIENAPLKTSMYPEGTTGEKLVVSGQVTAEDCVTPLAGAMVEVWQADARGEYDFSDQFLGRGHVIADENGYYTFETILPGRYEPRPLHIHIRVSHPDVEPVVTQIYFAGDNSGAPDALAIPLEKEGETWRGTFNIALSRS